MCDHQSPSAMASETSCNNDQNLASNSGPAVKSNSDGATIELGVMPSPFGLLGASVEKDISESAEEVGTSNDTKNDVKVDSEPETILGKIVSSLLFLLISSLLKIMAIPSLFCFIF
ncbi:hypothetical protein P9112_013476 [Eukaryota sp. TZLM1-RC]